MNIKNMLYISIVTASIANTLCPTGEVNESFQRQLKLEINIDK